MNLMGLMGEPVEYSTGNDRVREHIHPVAHGPVAGKDDRLNAIAAVNDAVEKLAVLLVDFFKSKIIDDEQVTVHELFDEPVG